MHGRTFRVDFSVTMAPLHVVTFYSPPYTQIRGATASTMAPLHVVTD